MSNKHIHEEQRLIKVAMAHLLKTEAVTDKNRAEVKRALGLAHRKIDECLADIRQAEHAEKLRSDADYARKVAKERQARADALKNEQECKQQLKKQRATRRSASLELRAERDARYAAMTDHDVEASNAAFRAASVAYKDVFTSYKIGGQLVGSVWYSQLYALRNKGVFEASLCQSILDYGKPSADMKVKDMVPAGRLLEFAKKAEQEARIASAAP